MPRGWPDFTVPITIEAVTVETLPIDIKAQTVGNIAIDIAAQTVGNINVNIAAQTANVNVNIAAQTADINVNVTNATINISGSVTITSGTVNVQTSSGVNLIIDKFTQTAYLERRSTLSNDNGVTTPTAPPASLTGTTYKGKYFAILCRGMLKTLQIYCKRTGAGKLTLAYSVGPNLGEIGSVEITPGADWDWKGASANKYWSYAPLFVWVKSCDGDVSYGYDTAGDPDGHTSADSGVTWTSEDRRYFIRALMTMQPIGVLPVGGVVNTIKIPSVSSDATSASVPLPTGETTSIIKVEGAGVTQRIVVRTSHDHVLILFFVDGVAITESALIIQSFMAHWLNDQGYTATTPQIQLMVFTEADTCRFNVLIPFEFKRSFEVKAQHATGVEETATVGIIYSKLG